MTRLASVAILVVLTAPAQAQTAPGGPIDGSALARFAAQGAVAALRTYADLTYAALTSAPDGRGVALTDARLGLPGAEEGCVVEIDRIDLAGAPGSGVAGLDADLTGVRAPLACLPPDAAEMLAGLGYAGLDAPQATLSLAYEIGSGALSARLFVELAEAASLHAEAAFSYFWVRWDPEAETFAPVAVLRGASATFVEEGLLTRLREETPPEAFDFALVGPLTEATVLDIATGGVRQATPEEARLAKDAGAAADRLVTDGGAVTLALRPEAPMSLDEAFEERLADPAGAIALLGPSVTYGRGSPGSEPIPPDALAAALSGEATDPAARRAAGLALLTGRGAPRAPMAGAKLLEPLAESDPEAAAALAEALAISDPAAAYPHALRAAAAGAPGAAGLRDAIESGLSAAEILRAQPSGEDARAEARAAARNGVAGLRRAALAAASGRETPRSYVQAYLLASLAAAGGDPAAAALRDRIARQMRAHGPAWSAREAELDALALEIWTGDGVAAALASGR